MARAGRLPSRQDPKYPLSASCTHPQHSPRAAARRGARRAPGTTPKPGRVSEGVVQTPLGLQQPRATITTLESAVQRPAPSPERVCSQQHRLPQPERQMPPARHRAQPAESAPKHSPGGEEEDRALQPRWINAHLKPCGEKASPSPGSAPAGTNTEPPGPRRGHTALQQPPSKEPRGADARVLTTSSLQRSRRDTKTRADPLRDPAGQLHVPKKTPLAQLSVCTSLIPRSRPRAAPQFILTPRRESRAGGCPPLEVAVGLGSLRGCPQRGFLLPGAAG